MKKINNYHLSLLIIIVFILNTTLFQSIKITQGQFRPPSEGPGAGTDSNIIVNPLRENLDLGGYNIFGEGKIGLGTEPNWDLHISKSLEGEGAEILVEQQSDSDARITTRTFPGGGDPSLNMIINDELHWSIGLDNDVEGNPPLKIGSSLNVGVNTIMTMLNNGNVGIGTTDPKKNLHIYDINSNAEINLQSIAGDGNHWGIYHDKSSYDLRFWYKKVDSEAVSQPDGGYITTVEENRLNITVDGDIGIGITEPIERLEIVEDDGNGVGIILQANRPINSAGHALGEIQFKASEDNGVNRGSGGEIGYLAHGDWVVGESTPSYMRISTTPAGSIIPVDRLKISSSGHVGIGYFIGTDANDNPGKDLHVRGLPSDRSVKIGVEATNTEEGYGWAGYSLKNALGTYWNMQFATNGRDLEFRQENYDEDNARTTLKIGYDGNVIIGGGGIGGGYTAESAGTVTFYDSGNGRFDYSFDPDDSPDGDSNIIEMTNHITGNRVMEGKFVSYGDRGVWSDIQSDYRLKQNVEDLDIGLGMINLLEPKKFQFKSSPNKNQTGFIAHEVGKLIPNAVIGEKDAVNKDGSIDPQFLQRNEIIPYLVKAVQELSAEITSLKNQLNNNN